MRAPTGTRIEETARLADEVEAAIRELDPDGPARDDPRQPRRAEQRHQPVVQQRRHDRHARRRDPAVAEARATGRPRSSSALLRAELPKRFPGIEFFFQPADIVTQILNFGLPAAIDVQFTGSNMAANAALAAELVKTIQQIPGAVDAHVHQRLDAPGRQPADGPHAAAADGPVGVQRRPERAGLAVGQLADGAGVLAQPAERRRLQRSRCRRRSTASTRSTRCSTCRSAAPARRQRRRRQRTQLLGNLVEATPARQLAVVSRYNITPVDRRLRQRAGHRPGERRRRRCRSWSTRSRPKLPRGSQVAMRGQVETMQSSFIGLASAWRWRSCWSTC